MANEKRLIDANELLRIYKKWIPQLILPQDQKDKEAIETCIKVLKDQPTVDAVEVVRCEECVNHGNCLAEDVFRIARIEKPYCCAGKKDGVRNA